MRVWILVCTFLLAASGAANAGSSDPMVWSDAQWRSTLFGGYSQTYNGAYDRRFRRADHRPRTAIVKIEQRVIVIDDNEAPKAKPRRAKLIGLRGEIGQRAGPGVLRFDGHRCRGVLVLTWGTLGAKSRCFHNGGRVRTM